MKWSVPIALVVGIGIGGAVAYGVAYGVPAGLEARTNVRPKAPRARYRFARAGRGDIVRYVTAAGRLDAVVTVKVSSQLSGQVAALLADFNDRVTAGQPLAQLDDKSYKAKLAEAEARLANARAALRQAEAQVATAQVLFKDAQNDLARKKRLHGRGVLSPREMETSEAKVAEARSKVAAAEAQRDVRKTDIRIAQALVTSARISLARTVIKAPIDGVVIERNVDLGQTVAASLQAPTLFTIAKDLRRMELNTFVDEADIGMIRRGQRALFRVDAFPGRYFRGRVTSIRKAPKVIQNVTIYTVVVSARNPKQLLLPGMTATTRIIVASRRNVLRLPNAALSFVPANAAAAKRKPDRRAGERRVWRWAGGALEPVIVKVGVRDDAHFEVAGGPLEAGDRVAIGRLPSTSRSRGLWRRLFGD